MFIRVNHTPNSPRKSIQIVQSHRKGNAVRQKIVRYVGVAMDEAEEKKLKALAEEIIAKLHMEREQCSPQKRFSFVTKEEEFKAHLTHVQQRRKPGRPQRKAIQDILPPNQVSLEDIVEQYRVVEGVHEVAGGLYETLYGTLFNRKRIHQQLKDMVLARLVEPASKHKTQKILEKRFDRKYGLDSLYRLMDKVTENIGNIKHCVFGKTRRLFPDAIDLVLFDVTTLHFESTKTDELRQFGYSKACRFNTTQVVLALATNSDGLPIGYELFEGNRAEVTTLVEAIEGWRKEFAIGSVCFVGDRAMLCKTNLKRLSEHGYDYVIAAKLRSLPKVLQKTILEEKHYRVTTLGDDLTWVGEFEYEGQRLITSFKTTRALRDQKERDRILEKIRKILGGERNSAKKAITNQGIKKFTSTNNHSITSLDEGKISQEALWDGMHGVLTSLRTEKAEAIVARYARLWVIEESFRLNKQQLKMRPIFHWKPKRIKAHIAICYMAFALLRHLQYRVALTQKLSVNVILEELLGTQASIYMDRRTKDLYRVPGNFSNNARKIYKTFNVERSLDARAYLP
jgi:transposase